MKNMKNYPLVIGGGMSFLLFSLIVIGCFWTPYDPTAMDVTATFSPPSFSHIMGTDQFGRDIFSRTILGARTSVGIALFTVLLGGSVGTFLGGVTGYFGGFVDRFFMGVINVITAFPSVLVALVLMSLLGSGTLNVILSLGLVFIPSFARVTRSTFATLAQENFIDSAKLMQVPTCRILVFHLLPNIKSVFLPCCTIGFNNALLAEASMSYLGIGVKPPSPSLGYMLSEAQGMIGNAPWYLFSVGLFMGLILFSVGLIGEGFLRKEGGR